MGKSAGSAPTPPDPFAVAGAQTKSNKDTAAFNAALARFDQITPFGSQTWSVDPSSGPQYNMDAYNKAMAAFSSGAGQDPHAGQTWVPPQTDETGVSPGYWTGGTGSSGSSPSAPKLSDFLISDGAPKYTSTQKLDPAIQRLVDANTAMQTKLSDVGTQALDRVSGTLATPFTLNARPIEDGGAIRDKVTQALYDRGARLLDPRYSQQENSERQRLLNAGFSVNDEGFTKALGNFNRSKDQAYADLADRAIVGGGLESDRAFNQSLLGHKQDISDALLQRQIPLQELMAIRGGINPQLPSFMPTQGVGGANPTDVAGIFGQGFNNLMSIYGQNVNQANADNATTGQVIGTAAMLAMMY